MITQEQANRLIEMAKQAIRTDTFVWELNRRQDEFAAAIEDSKIQFVLTLKRNPFEIRLHLRARDRDIGLVRIDNAPYHPTRMAQKFGISHIFIFFVRDTNSWNGQSQSTGMTLKILWEHLSVS
jgi:hypothetical protein